MGSVLQNMKILLTQALQVQVVAMILVLITVFMGQLEDQLKGRMI